VNLKQHWERIYATKQAQQVSWYLPRAERSLHLIRQIAERRTTTIIDVGGGASTLVDDLLHEGYTSLTVLDVSATALAAARERLGERAHQVTWLEADITQARLPEAAYDVWHDRAVFHFLTQPQQRAAYLATLVRALRPGGHVVIATFAEDGPEKCSGLPVVRYSPAELKAELGPAFTLVQFEREEHRTPAGSVQQFVYCLFRRAAP
jgi:ubiquinone/menaquinone biosynthesis C-methylase UbiE